LQSRLGAHLLPIANPDHCVATTMANDQARCHRRPQFPPEAPQDRPWKSARPSPPNANFEVIATT
jgi:hypothetical protein